jgi:hypothetical protein
MGVGDQRHAPAASSPGKGSGTHFTESWVGPRVCLDGCENIASTGIRSPDRPAISELQYRLRHPGPPYKYTGEENKRFCNVK